MGTDPWSTTDRLEAALLETMATRLESRARHPAFAAMREAYLDAMGIDGCATVLELGCGTGVVARAIAARHGFRGTVLGTDLSAHLVATATRLAESEGHGARLSFAVGDSGGLELGEGRFDAVIAHTLVSHVPDPAAIVHEAARLLAPGGCLTIFDGDFASRGFARERPEQMQRDDPRIAAGIAASPYAMRLMPRYLRESGLVLEGFLPHVLAEAGRAEFWASSIESNRTLLPTSGAMSADEAAAWAEEVERSSEEGVFFAAMNYYTYLARKP